MKRFFIMALGVLLLQSCKNNTTESSAKAEELNQPAMATTAESQQQENAKPTEISDISIYARDMDNPKWQ